MNRPRWWKLLLSLFSSFIYLAWQVFSFLALGFAGQQVSNLEFLQFLVRTLVLPGIVVFYFWHSFFKDFSSKALSYTYAAIITIAFAVITLVILLLPVLIYITDL